jgi:predicted RNA polymerase sigma factor
MLLHDSRREARLDADGNLVVLDEQDRRHWDAHQTPRRCRSWTKRFGPAPALTLQAAIAAPHRHARASTDCRRSRVRRAARRAQPSPIRFNHAAALAMVEGPPPELFDDLARARLGLLTARGGRSAARMGQLRTPRPVTNGDCDGWHDASVAIRTTTGRS